MYEGKEYEGTSNTQYEIDGKYIFILQHITNVYEERYTILADIYIPTDYIEHSTILSQNASKMIGSDDISKYISNYESINSAIKGKGEEINIDYIEDSDIMSLTKKSSYIAEITIKELLNETEVCDVFMCEVNEVIKGSITKTSNKEVIIPFFKDTVDDDRCYLVFLNSDTDDSYIYSLSSRYGVIDVCQKEKVKTILKGE